MSKKQERVMLGVFHAAGEPPVQIEQDVGVRKYDVAMAVLHFPPRAAALRVRISDEGTTTVDEITGHCNVQPSVGVARSFSCRLTIWAPALAPLSVREPVEAVEIGPQG